MSQAPLVYFTTFLDFNEAEIARGYLETNGIQCFLSNRSINTIMWHYTYAYGGIKMYVAYQDFERAKELLSNFVTEKKSDQLPWLPKSNSGKLQTIFFSLLFAFTGLFPWKRTSHL